MNPVLVEVTRGPMVESRHSGTLAVIGPEGRVLLALGDIEQPVFPRSAVKALQAVPLVATGTAERYNLSDAELALACGSHSGTDWHVALARRMLARARLGETALACGAHRPIDSVASDALILAGRNPGQMHNNCSGKHAGMVLTAAHCGEPLEGYTGAGHPVQQRIKAVIEAYMGFEVGDSTCGVDGCGVPTWAVPTRGLGSAFQRLITDAVPEYAGAMARIRAACWRHPEAVAGEGRLDTLVMRALPGQVFLKTGAEGVYCGAVKGSGVGIALKIDDGAKRAAEAVISAVLAAFVGDLAALNVNRQIANWRGSIVGETRLSDELRAGLDRLGCGT